MTRDIATLQEWIRAVVLIAAICSTSVPVIYMFSSWYMTKLGRLFMLQGLSFAAILDLTALFSVWTPKDILVIFWVDTIVLTAVAGSTISLAWFIAKTNFSRKRDRKNVVE